ncbi:unnamed protein product [Clonostachys solani]|uniref:Major facilitator superfamily (MFS) profile domain-containing protein n=1 Tax=Clonostachys solani TaxID=160281 RepID=A0A9P0E897_9HYPO|nr:unnamed protein product [Clonostachys solani]
MASLFEKSTLGKYVQTIKESPRELFFNSKLLFSTAVYAMTAMAITWDQGSSSVIPSLPGFAKAYGITSAANPAQVTNFISIVYLGAGVGSFLSYFLNDRIGRVWSLRVYFVVWICGQLIATFSDGKMPALYAARIVSGLGIGPLTVTGPMSIVEIAPTEFRGLLSFWFGIVLLLSLMVANLTVYATYVHISPSSLQYQIVWFVPIIVSLLVIIASIWAVESPRWLMLVGREDEAIENLVQLRGLPLEHERVSSELAKIKRQIQEEHAKFGENGGFKAILRETFLDKANLRRVFQTAIAYALAQITGANSVASYLIPILSLMGMGGEQGRNLLLAAMYSMAKVFYTIIASFFFVDALGRRNSLFIGITFQLVSDLYIGVYLKYRQAGSVTPGSSEGAIAAIFLHGFGFAVGLLSLPYIFGAELWPNGIRSFGSALSQTFHWLFFFAILRATPSILSSMDNWGAFIFFAGWCLISLVYVFFSVPETAGLSIEQLDTVFRGPWYKAYLSSKHQQQRGLMTLDGLHVADQEAGGQCHGTAVGKSKGDIIANH